jgi:hypothetical protein
MQTWEYRIVRIDTSTRKGKADYEKPTERDLRIEGIFASAGEEGWELVSFLPLPLIGSPLPSSSDHHAVFKRPKWNSPDDDLPN